MVFAKSLDKSTYVVARRSLPKQSPLKRVKLLKLEIASSRRTLLAKTFSDFAKAMCPQREHMALHGLYRIMILIVSFANCHFSGRDIPWGEFMQDFERI